MILYLLKYPYIILKYNYYLRNLIGKESNIIIHSDELIPILEFKVQ